MFKFLNLKFLQLSVWLFGGALVYVKLETYNNDIIIVRALKSNDCYYDTDDLFVKLFGMNKRLYKDGSIGPCIPLHRTDDLHKYGRWRFVNDRLHVEHLLKNCYN